LFLQVRENWKKSGNLCNQGKSGKRQEKILFLKSQKKGKENDFRLCKLHISVVFFVFPNIKKLANLRLSLKARSVFASGSFAS